MSRTVLVKNWVGPVSTDTSANDDGSATGRVSVEQRRRSAQRAWRYSGLLVPLSFAVLMFAALGIALAVHRRQTVTPIVIPNPDITGQKQNAKKTASGDQSEAGETASAATVAKIEFELRRAKFDMCVAHAKQAFRHFESAKTEWRALLGSTLTDSVGKRIGGNKKLLLRFGALQSLPESATGQLAKEAEAFLKRVLVDTQGAAGDVESLTHQTDVIERATIGIYHACGFHQALVKHLQAIRTSAASLPEGKFELHAAVSLRAAAATDNASAVAVKTTRELQASLDQELAQWNKQKDDGDELLKQLNSDLASVEKGESLDRGAIGSNIYEVASRKDFERELDDIRTKLIAFTTSGYVQPESADKLVSYKVKEPVSYSKLLRCGALEDSDKGLAILFRVGGSKSATQRNDRPLGNFPRMHSVSELQKPDIVARVKEAQRLLRQYGPLMVEDGLLSR